MSDDRTLLERAARAAGIEHPGGEHSIHADGRLWDCKALRWWNPLTDDGDALRLAVACGLVVDASRPSAGVPFTLHHFSQDDFTDVQAATRRAITRAAAAMAGEE